LNHAIVCRNDMPQALAQSLLTKACTLFQLFGVTEAELVSLQLLRSHFLPSSRQTPQAFPLTPVV
jgi:hypothetical protein